MPSSEIAVNSVMRVTKMPKQPLTVSTQGQYSRKICGALHIVLFSQQLEKGQGFKFWVPHFKSDINKK